MKRDEMFSELRRLNREHMHMIWQVAKSGDLDVLDGEERRLAELTMNTKLGWILAYLSSIEDV